MSGMNGVYVDCTLLVIKSSSGGGEDWPPALMWPGKMKSLMLHVHDCLKLV